MIGFIAEKYESGGRGPGLISDNPKDPGGTSYGIFQLSYVSGTLKKFIDQSIFKDRLTHPKINSPEFKQQWKSIASSFPFDFRYDQYVFIFKELFLPASFLATYAGFNTSTQPIQEALFSIAVQHRNYKEIILTTHAGPDTISQVVGLYAARKQYVESLKLDPILLGSILARYAVEQPEVLGLPLQVS